jgi:transcription elongation factor Elf1
MANGTLTRKAKRQATGFALCCIQCGEEDVNINLSLKDLQSVTCESCGDSYSVETAIVRLADRLAQWRKVAELVELAGQMIAGPESSDDV